jgi:hypothetical protein
VPKLTPMLIVGCGGKLHCTRGILVRNLILRPLCPMQPAGRASQLPVRSVEDKTLNAGDRINTVRSRPSLCCRSDFFSSYTIWKALAFRSKFLKINCTEIMKLHIC